MQRYSLAVNLMAAAPGTCLPLTPLFEATKPLMGSRLNMQGHGAVFPSMFSFFIQDSPKVDGEPDI